MRITDMITQDGFVWYFINFSPLRMRIQILILGSKALRYRKTGNKNYATCLATLLQNVLNSDVARFITHRACEQALLFGRASRGCASEGPSPELPLPPARAPRSFATRSRILARLASLAQIGELACRLPPTLNLSCNKSGCYLVWTWVVKRET